MKKRFGALLVLAGGALLVWLFLPRPNLSQKEGEAPTLDWFEEVSGAWGLTEAQDAGAWDGNYFMPQILGGGVAAFDADGDGRLDLLLLNHAGPNGKPNRLYLQKEPHRFTLASPGHGLDLQGVFMGVAIGDVNRDGKPDVLLTEYRGARIFVNKGQGRFEELSQSLGLANPHWGTSCAIADLDRDGWPDLVVANYVNYDPTWPCTGPSGKREFCPPHTFSGQPTKVWRNLGPVASGSTGTVRFADMTQEWGLADRPGPGLGLALMDANGDQWLDILVANDGKPNHLWIRQNEGKYREEALDRGLAYNTSGKAQAGMGIALGDFRGTGRLDVFMTHLAEETHTLWSQTGPGLFRDQTSLSGLLASGARSTGFGVVAEDFNRDGFLDLFLANGRISARPGEVEQTGDPFGAYAETNMAFQGLGAGKFLDLTRSLPSFCSQANIARGMATGDFNDDGLPDLVVTRINQPPLLLLNRQPVRATRVDFGQKQGGLPGVLQVLETGGTRSRLHFPGLGGSFLSASQNSIWVGAGSPTEGAKRSIPIVVTWQDGTTESLVVDASLSAVRVEKGTGSPPGKRGEP